MVAVLRSVLCPCAPIFGVVKLFVSLYCAPLFSPWYSDQVTFRLEWYAISFHLSP